MFEGKWSSSLRGTAGRGLQAIRRWGCAWSGHHSCFSFCLERNGEMEGSQSERQPGTSIAFWVSTNPEWPCAYVLNFPLKLSSACSLIHPLCVGSCFAQVMFFTCSQIPFESPQCFIYPTIIQLWINTTNLPEGCHPNIRREIGLLLVFFFSFFFNLSANGILTLKFNKSTLYISDD